MDIRWLHDGPITYMERNGDLGHTRLWLIRELEGGF